MTRTQKLMLLILGVLDLAVIGALAGIVIHTASQVPALPTVVRVQVSPCAQKLLDAGAALPAPFDSAPTVAWDSAQLYVTLHASYSTGAPPEESAQLLWTALDSIAAVLRDGCAVPQTITIALTAQGETETLHYLAQLAGDDIAAWMAGALPEADLAAHSHFRQSRQ